MTAFTGSSPCRLRLRAGALARPPAAVDSPPLALRSSFFRLAPDIGRFAAESSALVLPRRGCRPPVPAYCASALPQRAAVWNGIRGRRIPPLRTRLTCRLCEGWFSVPPVLAARAGASGHPRASASCATSSLWRWHRKSHHALTVAHHGVVQTHPHSRMCSSFPTLPPWYPGTTNSPPAESAYLPTRRGVVFGSSGAGGARGCR